MTRDTDLVKVDVRERIAVLTINRPPVNAFSTELWNALGDAVGRIDADEGVHVGILTAQGRRAFSAGADVHELVGLTAESRRERGEWVLEAMRRVAEARVPMIAAINGPAVGGGFNLVTLCDYRIAAEDAYISLPEIDRGTVGGGGVFLRRLGIPDGAMREIVFTGRRIAANEALALRLVDRVVPYDELMPAALELADAMARKARPALVLMKQALRATELEADWIAGYRTASGFSAELAEKPEVGEGLAAFLGKREASYERRG